MRTHNKHVLMCTGNRCSENNTQVTTMFEQLGSKIDDRHVGCAEVRSASLAILMCFTAFSTSYNSTCKNDPILVIYPEGVWYSCANETVLEHIVSEHLEQDTEVTEHVFYRLGSGDV